jgi:hypothetical protein
MTGFDVEDWGCKDNGQDERESGNEWKTVERVGEEKYPGSAFGQTNLSCCIDVSAFFVVRVFRRP